MTSFHSALALSRRFIFCYFRVLGYSYVVYLRSMPFCQKRVFFSVTYHLIIQLKEFYCGVLHREVSIRSSAWMEFKRLAILNYIYVLCKISTK